MLNQFATLPKEVHRQVRACLQQALQNETAENPLPASAKISVSDCTLHMPLHVGNFTDYSCSREHNLLAGNILLGSTSLPPAFFHYPLGYTGRASSIVLSGTPVQRPLGLFRDGSDKVIFGPEKKLDFELELACVIGQPVAHGAGCSVEKASNHIFGYALLNDWSGEYFRCLLFLLRKMSKIELTCLTSARDIQGFEMRPLGPMNGKSFQTSISPWIVTSEALESYQVDAVAFETPPATYLQRDKRTIPSISLQAEIITSNKPSEGAIVCTSRVESLYWNFEDMIAQQTVNGCSLGPGDIVSTGTVSDSGPNQRGCLLEASMGGKTPLAMSDGTSRSYLEDGDIVKFTGFATIPGSDVVIEFGECTGQIMPARQVSI